MLLRIFIASALLSFVTETVQACTGCLMAFPAAVFRENGKEFLIEKSQNWSLRQAQESIKQDIQTNNNYRNLESGDVDILDRCFSGGACTQPLSLKESFSVKEATAVNENEKKIRAYDFPGDILIVVKNPNDKVALFVDMRSNNPVPLFFQSIASFVDVDKRAVIFTKCKNVKIECQVYSYELQGGKTKLILNIPYLISDLIVHEERIYAFAAVLSQGNDLGSVLFSWSGHFPKNYDWYMLEINLYSGNFVPAPIKKNVRSGDAYFLNKWSLCCRLLPPTEN